MHKYHTDKHTGSIQMQVGTALLSKAAHEKGTDFCFLEMLAFLLKWKWQWQNPEANTQKTPKKAEKTWNVSITNRLFSPISPYLTLQFSDFLSKLQPWWKQRFHQRKSFIYKLSDSFDSDHNETLKKKKNIIQIQSTYNLYMLVSSLSPERH